MKAKLKTKRKQKQKNSIDSHYSAIRHYNSNTNKKLDGFSFFLYLIN